MNTSFYTLQLKSLSYMNPVFKWLLDDYINSSNRYLFLHSKILIYFVENNWIFLFEKINTSAGSISKTANFLSLQVCSHMYVVSHNFKTSLGLCQSNPRKRLSSQKYMFSFSLSSNNICLNNIYPVMT